MDSIPLWCRAGGPFSGRLKRRLEPSNPDKPIIREVRSENTLAGKRPWEKTSDGTTPASRTSVRVSGSSFWLGSSVLAVCLAGVSQAQTQSTPVSPAGPPTTSVPDAPVPVAGADIKPGQPPLTAQQRAEEQLKQQERQRIAGVVPNFNVSYSKDAAPLSKRQKLKLAWRTATDPVAFGIAGFDAGLSRRRTIFLGTGRGHRVTRSASEPPTRTTSMALSWGTQFFPFC
jgi:hypothetical protein